MQGGLIAVAVAPHAPRLGIEERVRRRCAGGCTARTPSRPAPAMPAWPSCPHDPNSAANRGAEILANLARREREADQAALHTSAPSAAGEQGRTTRFAFGTPRPGRCVCASGRSWRIPAGGRFLAPPRSLPLIPATRTTHKSNVAEPTEGRDSAPDSCQSVVSLRLSGAWRTCGARIPGVQSRQPRESRAERQELRAGSFWLLALSSGLSRLPPLPRPVPPVRAPSTAPTVRRLRSAAFKRRE